MNNGWTATTTAAPRELWTRVVGWFSSESLSWEQVYFASLTFLITGFFYIYILGRAKECVCSLHFGSCISFSFHTNISFNNTHSHTFSSNDSHLATWTSAHTACWAFIARSLVLTHTHTNTPQKCCIFLSVSLGFACLSQSIDTIVSMCVFASLLRLTNKSREALGYFFYWWK